MAVSMQGNIQNENSKLFLDVDEYGKITQQPKNKAKNPQWELVPVEGEDSYYIKNLPGGGFLTSTDKGMLSVQKDQKSARAPGAQRQYWKPIKVAGGYYQLCNQGNQLFVSVESASTAPGGRVVLAEEAKAGHQYWLIPTKETTTTHAFREQTQWVPSGEPQGYNKIPIIVELYDHYWIPGGYEDQNSCLVLTNSVSNLDTLKCTVQGHVWGNRVSGIKIRPGPDYDPCLTYEVSFYRDPGYKGPRLVLSLGEYPNLHGSDVDPNPYLGLGDTISSVELGRGVPKASPIPSIPLVAELYLTPNFGDPKVTILENVPDLKHYHYFIDTWGGSGVKSVRVHKGPNYDDGSKPKVVLYRDKNYQGAKLELDIGDHSDVSNFLASSVKVNPSK